MALIHINPVAKIIHEIVYIFQVVYFYNLMENNIDENMEMSI